ncbi:MAG: hypothetical protein P8X81_10840 [Woeseiaceae bacterium]
MQPNSLVGHGEGRRRVIYYEINKRGSINSPTRRKCSQKVFMENALEGVPVTFNFRVDPCIIERD